MVRSRGHRVVSHTADIRIEAWAATREDCISEIALAAVESFVDTSPAGLPTVRSTTVRAESDEDLLVAVIEEIIYRMDTTGEVPVDLVVAPETGGATVSFGMVPTDGLPQVGAIPKAVSLHELRMAEGEEGWQSAVTLDV